jgi:hypothetical protein
VFSVERVEDRRDEGLRVIAQHRHCETQNPPARRDERVLPPTVGLEQILVRLVQPSIDLDCQLLLLEGDIDVEQLIVHAHWQIGLPAFDPSRTQQPMT